MFEAVIFFKAYLYLDASYHAVLFCREFFTPTRANKCSRHLVHELDAIKKCIFIGEARFSGKAN